MSMTNILNSFFSFSVVTAKQITCTNCARISSIVVVIKKLPVEFCFESYWILTRLVVWYYSRKKQSGIKRVTIILVKLF